MHDAAGGFFVPAAIEKRGDFIDVVGIFGPERHPDWIPGRQFNQKKSDFNFLDALQKFDRSVLCTINGELQIK